MGLFLRQETDRSQLQSKVAMELRERLQQRDLGEGESEPAILEDQHTTRVPGVVIVALLVILLGAFIYWLLRLGGIL